MKCSKCGNEMRLWVNENTKQSMATCDTCKYDIPIFNQKTATINLPAKKHSGLSIAALILSVIGCSCFIGLILGIIDLVKKDNSKKHGMSIAAIIISAIWILLAAIGASSSDTNTAPAVQNIESSDTFDKEPAIDNNAISETEEITTSTEWDMNKSNEEKIKEIEEDLNSIKESTDEIWNDPDVQNSYQTFKDSVKNLFVGD